jgi:dihydroxy-acid dehydratase
MKMMPYVAPFACTGRDVAKDIVEAGRVPLLTRTLLDDGYHLGECLTETGRTAAGTLNRARWNKDQLVVRPADNPLAATGGVVGLMGNLASLCAIRIAGMADFKSTGPARCFDGEEARFSAVKKKKYREGELLVIRHEGPHCGPGMREMPATRAPDGKVALVAGAHTRDHARHAGLRPRAMVHAGAAVGRTCHAGI